ncbi:MAG: phosphoenolpyruvate carboxykinase [Blastocatellia bacterium]|nr:phosphoenolpyruvate carboxykinase [Blastocatellia bacterium]
MPNRVPAFGLAHQGIDTGATLFWNLGTPSLVEHAIRNGEGLLAKDGPFVVQTGKHTGRAAKDKFIVRDAETESEIWWDNNASMTPAHFAALKDDFLAALGERKSLYVQDLYGGSDMRHETLGATGRAPFRR